MKSWPMESLPRVSFPSPPLYLPKKEWDPGSNKIPHTGWILLQSEVTQGLVQKPFLSGRSLSQLTDVSLVEPPTRQLPRKL
jgi:hypothetical protein